MKFWVTALKIIGRIWLTLASIIILLGVYGVWHKEGFSAVQELMSPFNVLNYVAIVTTIAPGVGALMWSDKLKSKLAE